MLEEIRSAPQIMSHELKHKLVLLKLKKINASSEFCWIKLANGIFGIYYAAKMSFDLLKKCKASTYNNL